MKLNKKQIASLKKAHLRAEKAANEFSIATQAIAEIITDLTGINGNCDHLSGDGFGFTPSSNDDTQIPINELIEHAENGIDITEEFILGNLSI